MKQGQAFGALWVYGVDASTFLDGQLTVNVSRLKQQWAIGAYCTHQGKVIAILWVLDICLAGEPGYLLLMPNELLDTVKQRLQKYVLRSQVRMDKVGVNLMAVANIDALSLKQPHAVKMERRPLLIDSQHPNRIILLGLSELTLQIDVLGDEGVEPRATTTSQSQVDLAFICGQLIQQGIPCIYTQTSEEFVPQMLGLLAIGGLDLNKGCYVGQEVVARLHYKTTLRRHLAWTETMKGLGDVLQPGTNLFSEQRKVATILAYIANEKGGILQVVVQKDFIDKPLHLQNDREHTFIFSHARTSAQGI